MALVAPSQADPTIAICAIVRDEERYIAEWMAFHLLQGVSKMLIYDDGSADKTCEIVSRAGTRAPIQLIDWTGNSKSFDQAQRNAYREAAARHLRHFDFVAFIDADEFLFSANGLSLGKELAAFPSDVSAVAINQRVFGSSGHKLYSPEPVTSRFTKCTPVDHGENEWFKTIARPGRIYAFDSVHTVRTSWGRHVLNDGGPLEMNGHHGRATRIGKGALNLNHYMLKSLEEFRDKQARGQRRGMGDRYKDGYFNGRDTPEWGNALDNSNLASMRVQIEAKIDEIIS